MKFYESTLVQLYNSALKAFPLCKYRQHSTNTIKIVKLEWVPFVGMKTLFVKGLAQNEGREYNTLVLFKNMNYLTEDKQAVKIIASDGLPYKFDKIIKEETDVLLRCNCPDFRWRFAWWNKLDHSLYGRAPAKYKSLGNRPANPMQLEGMCKHLMKTIKALYEANIFL